MSSKNLLVINIFDIEFENQVVNGKGYVLVVFWADWCAPCQVIAPIIEKLANLLINKVKFYKINICEHRENAGKYGVKGIPSMLLFDNGELINIIHAQEDMLNFKVLLQWININTYI